MIRAKRIGAFLIDFACILLVSLLANVPGFNIVPATLVILYQLFRDYSGASLGKHIMGLRVITTRSGPLTKVQCVLRNVLFVVPAFALFIPLPGIGFLADNSVLLMIYLVEVTLLLTTGARVGDRLAGTAVTTR